MSAVDVETLVREVRQLRGEVSALHARVDSLEAASGKFVPDKDLDGPKGSFRVPFSPRAWKGADHKGKEIRDCPPDFLLVLAEFFDWSAANPKVRPGRERYAESDRANEVRRGALCRSWARRKAAGWTPPEEEEVGDFPGDTPLPGVAVGFVDFDEPAYTPPATVLPSDEELDDIPF